MISGGYRCPLYDDDAAVTTTDLGSDQATRQLDSAPAPRGIADTDWIPTVGDRGWVMITHDRRLRTRPAEAELAIAHRLKVVHLHGKVGC